MPFPACVQQLLPSPSPLGEGRGEVPIDAHHINRTFDLLALASRDTRLKRVGARHEGPCPFDGGRDRFIVIRRRQGYRWLCRTCTEGHYRTPIDYIMRRDHLDFLEALKSLGGTPERTATLASPREPEPASLSAPDAEWQAAAWREVDAASKALASDEGCAAREYLLRRGLHGGTWLAWLLGCAQVYDPTVRRRRPAISLPWFDLDGRGESISAVKYRFIEDDPEGLRYIARRGSVPVLYGLSQAVPNQILLLVEGEFNALSIWQCLPRGVMCLSFGGQTGARPESLRELAKGYARLVVWADDASRAAHIGRLLGDRRVERMHSPTLDGLKPDANALLQRGLLAEALRIKLGVVSAGTSV